MASEEQIAANRRNHRPSIGRRQKAGAASSENDHGSINLASNTAPRWSDLGHNHKPPLAVSSEHCRALKRQNRIETARHKQTSR